RQSVIMARVKQKRQILSKMLADPAMASVLVFSRTKHGADRITRDLERDGFPAAVIHGNKSQNARQNALNGFRDGSARILVATDIAARGIDVPGISHVVNFDLPDEPESYVHRIGRTGRNGADGIAVTLCDPAEASKLRAVERVIRMKLPVVADHTGQPDPARTAADREPVRSETAGERGGRREHNRGGERHQNGQRNQGNRGHPGAKPNGHKPHRNGEQQHGGRHGGQQFAEKRDGNHPRQRPQGDEKGGFKGLPGSGAGAPGERKPFRGKRRGFGKRPAIRAA
ncbi:MAG: helicase-related protein, partial [Pseudorhodoplanes sp.]